MKIIKIAIIGDYALTDDYSNIKHFILSLKKDKRFIVKKTYGGGNTSQKYYSTNKIRNSLIILLMRRIFNALKACLSILKTRDTDVDVIYIPYLSSIILFLLSFIPKKIRHPNIIADGLISVYDTIVNDRKIISKKNILSKLIWYVEKKSFQCARIIIVDTDKNGIFYSNLFKLNKSKFKQVPLCIDENLFKLAPTVNNNKQLKVLFAGGFIPLQGVDTIIKAANILKNKTSIKFHLIGEGQSDKFVANYIKKHSLSISWRKEWICIEDLAREYQNADVCLGIFGQTHKRERVWPFKNYYAMATGKPVISASFNDISLPNISKYILPIQPTTPSELAKAIVSLSETKKRYKLGAKGNKYYNKHLTNKISIDKFYNICRCIGSA